MKRNWVSNGAKSVWRKPTTATMGLVLMKVFNGLVYNHGAVRMVPGYDKAALAKLPGAAFR